jgi:hypothetical protein
MFADLLKEFMVQKGVCLERCCDSFTFHLAILAQLKDSYFLKSPRSTAFKK